ncbi:hypothetical protein HGB25_02930 [Candidatus Saccharibacteria bacterium]|nr:hypothetical protein [Candidatus Saccharibacteria bacterium]
MTLHVIENLPDREVAPADRNRSVAEDVGVSMEALRILGINDDPEQQAEILTAKYTRLREGQPRSGELFVHLPIDDTSFCLRAMIKAVDIEGYTNGRGSDSYIYPGSWIDGDLWKFDDYNTKPLDAVQNDARLAVSYGMDDREPLLHFLDQSIDDQLKSLASAQVDYAKENPEFRMTVMDGASFVMLALQRRIKGEVPPVNWGLMRLPFHRREVIDRIEFGAHVSSREDRLKFGRSFTYKEPNKGIGLSVGEL